jgi:hypothetical protein
MTRTSREAVCGVFRLFDATMNCKEPAASFLERNGPMHVQFTNDAVAATFDELEPGTFFACLRGTAREYGFCVRWHDKKGAALFNKSGNQQGKPCWFSPNGVGDGTILSFPSAVMRPKYSASVAFDGIHRPGSIFNVDSKVYIEVFGGAGAYHAFDLQTGTESNPAEKNRVIHPDWEVGLLIDDRFEPIFTFPKDCG